MFFLFVFEEFCNNRAVFVGFIVSKAVASHDFNIIHRDFHLLLDKTSDDLFGLLLTFIDVVTSDVVKD